MVKKRLLDFKDFFDVTPMKKSAPGLFYTPWRFCMPKKLLT